MPRVSYLTLHFNNNVQTNGKVICQAEGTREHQRWGKSSFQDTSIKHLKQCAAPHCMTARLHSKDAREHTLMCRSRSRPPMRPSCPCPAVPHEYTSPPRVNTIVWSVPAADILISSPVKCRLTFEQCFFCGLALLTANNKSHGSLYHTSFC